MRVLFRGTKNGTVWIDRSTGGVSATEAICATSATTRFKRAKRSSSILRREKPRGGGKEIVSEEE